MMYKKKKKNKIILEVLKIIRLGKKENIMMKLFIMLNKKINNKQVKNNFES